MKILIACEYSGVVRDAFTVGSLISIENLERIHIEKILERGLPQAETSKVLGIDVATLYRKRKQYGLINDEA